MGGGSKRFPLNYLRRKPIKCVDYTVKLYMYCKLNRVPTHKGECINGCMPVFNFLVFLRCLNLKKKKEKKGVELEEGVWPPQGDTFMLIYAISSVNYS